MSTSFELVRIFQEHLEKNELLSATEIIKNQTSETLHLVCSEVINVVSSYLTEQNYASNTNKYLACETILKLIAEKATKEDVLFELLEVLEGVEHDEKFTTVLKALQVVLLRMDHNKTQAIAWVLDGIGSYIENKISLPNVLQGQVSPEMEKLIENDPIVQRLLSLYITIFLFLEPIQSCLLEQTRDDTKIFFSQDFNSRNVMTTFLLKLMEGTFAHLNFSHDPKGPKTYGRQCAENLLRLFSKSFPDMFKLLQVMEERDSHQNSPQKSGNKGEVKNIFYCEDRFTTLSVAIVFYLRFVEKIYSVSSPPLPQVYKHEYIIEKALILVNFLLNKTQTQLQQKGVDLGLALLSLVPDGTLSENDVDLDERNTFYESLNKVIIYSPAEKNRKKGLKLFDMFLTKHLLSAKYKIIDHLFNTVSHSGLLSHAIMSYKTVIVRLLSSGNLNEKHFSTIKFNKVMKEHVCHLKQGEQTDLMENHEVIMTALNFLIFLMMRDKDNCTGIFNVIDDVQKIFLDPLDRALQLSRAHYVNETRRIESGEDRKMEQKMDIDIQNDFGGAGLDLTKEKKLEILTYSTNMFDIMTRLLARVNECVDVKNKK